MYPEAGGSSSFARHAFNELVSFIAAWGQMLNYTITVAISAFFVPHYLAVFWPWLGEQPRRHHRRRGADRRPRPDQHPRHRGVGETEPDPRRRRPRDPGGPGRDRPRPRPQPADPGRQRPPRRRPDLERLRARDRGRDDRLHRDRDDLQHGRGGQGRGPDDPPQRRPHGRRRARPLPADPDRRPLGDAGHPGRRRPLLDRARHDLRRRPDPRHRREPRPLPPADRNPPLLRRRPRRGDPADRDQRRPDRRLPPHLLDGPAPPAARGPAPGPPEVPHPLHRDPDLRRDRDRHPAAGPDRLPGDDVLVRGDALVHDRPRRGDPAAAQANPTSSGPGSRRSTSAPSASRCRSAPCSAASAPSPPGSW